MSFVNIFGVRLYIYKIKILLIINNDDYTA